MRTILRNQRLLTAVRVKIKEHQVTIPSFFLNHNHFASMSDQRSMCCGGDVCSENSANQQPALKELFFNHAHTSVIEIPDAHCHLQLDPLFDQRQTIIQNAKLYGITCLSVCGVCPGDDWNRINTLFSEFPDNIIANYGLHPWWIRKFIPFRTDNSGESWAVQLEQLLQDNPKAGVGECGLDKNIGDSVTLEEQDEILTKHLRLARLYKRPLTIHCVGYWAKLLEILKREFGVSSKKNTFERELNPPVILHSCNSMPVDMISQFLKVNCSVYCSLSAGGNFEKSSKLIQAIPRENLLLETDSPDQLLHDLRGKLLFNEPCVLRHYCHVYAAVVGISSEELALQVRSNHQQAFAVCL